jgi:alpha-mannosidase
VVVFNPSHFKRTDLVHATVELPHDVTAYELVDENGKPLPFQERRVGSNTIINTILDPKMMRSMFGNINDGRAAGMTIQTIKVNRMDAEVYIEATMANGGDPNISAWNAGREAIEGYLSDPSVTTYHLNAHSLSTRQITFVIPEVPGLGYRTIWIHALSRDEKVPFHLNPLFKFLLPLSRLPIFKKINNPPNGLKPGNRIENEFFVVSIENGTITLKDKLTGVVMHGLNRFMDGGDCGDEYNYSPPNDDRLIIPICKRVRLTDGVVLQSLVVELELSIPGSLSPNRKARSKKRVCVPITTTISLVKGVPRIDIHTTIDNHACDHRLRVHFPASFSADYGSHDGHFEVVDRPVGIPEFDETWVEQPRPEVPQQAFTSVTDGKTGLTLANRGLPEVEVLKNSQGNAEIAITLLRCVGWLSRDDFSTRKGHAGPFLETPGAQMPGIWNYDYSILSHPGDWHNALPHAYGFTTPLRVISSLLHQGSLPTLTSFVQADPAAFVISAIKHAEDGKSLLVRGYNITAETIKVDIKLWRGFKKVTQVNFAENISKALKHDKDGCVTFLARGHEIVSLLFRD